MYNAILDEFEDDGRRPAEAEGFDVRAVAVMAAEDENEPVVSVEATLGDEEPKSEDLHAAQDDVESWSDDPVRMYLTQMGEIPLLTRKQEIALAKKIEITRSEFRRKLLECDYVIRSAFKILRRVHQGQLPFDRTVQVSVTDRLEKDQILGRLPHNLLTIDALLTRNQEDYLYALSKSQPKRKRLQAWQRLGRCRRRARLAYSTH